MRIVVSGTHASGKSALISDFVLRHSEFTVLPDPFEFLDEVDDSPNAAMFAAQLRIAAQRLNDLEPADTVIAERGPIDFLAYLLATAELTGTPIADEILARAIEMTAEAMSNVDLLIVLPLTESDQVHVGLDEFLELRNAMDGVLLDLIANTDVVGRDVEVTEITGAPEARVAALDALVSRN